MTGFSLYVGTPSLLEYDTVKHKSLKKIRESL